MFASRRADPEDLKANIRRQNLDDNNDNNNDGDHIHWNPPGAYSARINLC